MTDRPLSPHLQVYKPQLTSMLSILHRATGATLYMASLLVVYWLFALASGSSHAETLNSGLTEWWGKLVLYGILFCVYYHLANGLRHLMWDTGKGLDLKTAYLTGWLVLVFSLVATGLTVFLMMGGA